MVVKPFANLVRTTRGYAQPGVKVRGREYLRLIYGPDYTEPANLERLRERNLGHKRSLALREYALGVEALERAVQREALWRVHEAVFAVLALESEPVDPRLCPPDGVRVPGRWCVSIYSCNSLKSMIASPLLLAHAVSMMIGSLSVRPSSVRLYSTLGGASA